jgi:hypothetical protein
MDIAEIRGAVARGWCAEGNAHKEMDSVLAEAISQEVHKLIYSRSPRAFAEQSAAALAGDMEDLDAVFQRTNPPANR